MLPRLFGPRISVRVTAVGVEFRGPARVLALSPDLFVKDGIVIAVGMPPAELEERLPVFVTDATERALRLSKLIGYGLHTVIGKSVSVKPIVLLSVDPAVVSEAEVRAALLDAGAARVTAA